MNNKLTSLLVVMILIALIVSGCATPAATPTSPPPATVTTSTVVSTVFITAVPPTAQPTTAAVAKTTTTTTTAASSAAAKPSPTTVKTSSNVDDSKYPVADLMKAFSATLPAKAFEGVQAIGLTNKLGPEPLYAVHTYGLRSFEKEPPPSHVVALYTYRQNKWVELARMLLDEGAQDPANNASPDFLNDVGSVVQVQVEPTVIWLAVYGGAGAHGGTFQLLGYNGENMWVELSSTSGSPGFGNVEDVNGDGVEDVVLDVSDKYIFCYACGVRRRALDVYTWSEENQAMERVSLIPMESPGMGDTPMSSLNQAISFAQAGLWKDAWFKASEAKKGPDMGLDKAAQRTFNWNYTLIKLHNDAMVESVKEDAYPLLANVFYGDYAAAVKQMAAESPEKLFSSKSALIVGTVAEQQVEAMSDAIIASTKNWLALEPDLAHGYFLRGWAKYQADPKSAAARADIAKAAELAPSEALFTKSKAVLK